jgi:hypothetical protein
MDSTRPAGDWLSNDAPRRTDLVRLVGVLAALQVLFLVGLVAAQAVPDRPIVDHLLVAVDDGLYGPNLRPNNMGGLSEAFTECVAVGTGLGRPDMGVWERAMRVPRIGSCSDGPGQLRQLAAGEDASGVTEYFRYWSGYTVITRPVLAMWGIGTSRMLSGALMIGSGVWAMVALARRTSTAYASVLVAPLLLSTHMLAMPSTSLLGALALAAAFLSVALTAIGAGRGLVGAMCGAVVGAAVFNYVDLLSTPAMPWMLSTVAAAAVILARTGDARRAGRTALTVGITWPIAFGLTWLTRWALAVVALGWSHAKAVIGDKIAYRLDGATGSVESGFGAATRVNVRYWWNTIPTSRLVLAVVIVATVFLLVSAYRRRGRRPLAWFAVLAAPAAIVPIWYEVLSNHSVIHAAKTYVNVPAALGVIAAAAVFASSIEERSAVRSGADVLGVDGGPPRVVEAELQDREEEAAEYH